MNERIKLLAKKAGINLTPAQFSGVLEDEVDEFTLEKFAELIVRECIKESMEEVVADDEIAQKKDPLIREYLNGNNQGVVDAVVRFRNHFGVEP